MTQICLKVSNIQAFKMIGFVVEIQHRRQVLYLFAFLEVLCVIPTDFHYLFDLLRFYEIMNIEELRKRQL